MANKLYISFNEAGVIDALTIEHKDSRGKVIDPHRHTTVNARGETVVAPVPAEVTSTVAWALTLLSPAKDRDLERTLTESGVPAGDVREVMALIDEKRR